MKPKCVPYKIAPTASDLGFPGGAQVKNPPAKAGDAGLIPGSGRSPWRRKWRPTPVFLAGKSHGQRSLAGYSPWGSEELDTTELITNLENCWSETIQHWSQTPTFYSEKPKFYLPTNLRRWRSKLLLSSSMHLWAHPLTATHVTTTTIPSEHILITLPEKNFATYKSFPFCYISSDILMFPVHLYHDFSGPLWFRVTKG